MIITLIFACCIATVILVNVCAFVVASFFVLGGNNVGITVTIVYFNVNIIVTIYIV